MSQVSTVVEEVAAEEYVYLDMDQAKEEYLYIEKMEEPVEADVVAVVVVVETVEEETIKISTTTI